MKGYDVKYVVGSGWEKDLDPALLFPFETLERKGRSRRGRDFLIPAADKITRAEVAAGTENEKPSINITKKSSSKKRENLAQKKAKPKRPRKNARGSAPAASPATTTPERKSKPKATKVTPIPSIVIANDEVDVSPLERTPLNKGNAKSTASDHCRRGLFASSIRESAKVEKKKSSSDEKDAKNSEPRVVSYSIETFIPLTSNEISIAVLLYRKQVVTPTTELLLGCNGRS